MKKEEQISRLNQLDKDTIELIKTKSEDYAKDIDVLSNFKIVSKLIELIGVDVTKPEGYAMLMVLLKIVRIWNLKSANKIPNNESLLDSYKDLINYAKLSLLNEIESNKNVTTENKN